jgi:hypothetical protein
MKAFPAYEWNENHKQMMAVGGMDLRDYFAAKAMQALVAKTVEQDEPAEIAAEAAYLFADAMMKARNG